MNPKQTILDILNQSDRVISGETLSAELGISRVSIWKHIKGLVQSGVPIVSSPKGYRLTRDPDNLHPWAFGTRREQIHFFQDTASTMDEAARLARDGCPAFTVVLAQRQTCGRGRMQRSWTSDEGGLYFTVVVRPDIPLMHAGLVNLAAAIDMADLLRTRYRIDAGLKWPNDILVNDKKICGILSQMEAEGDQVAHVNIGLGLNVNNQPETDQPAAVSLKTLLGRPVPRREILTGFLEAFEARMRDFKAPVVVEQWRADNVTLGKPVRVCTVKETVDGRAVNVDANGGLVLQLSDGSQRTVVHGDCFHQE
jgi:BirA family biotin operon repressor/biotin-[acetyl-CoA-carboxylase] ligase